MSKVNDLIMEYCPEGVPFRKLGEIGSFYGGLTGKSKEDFKDGNAVFITYMNVYSNIELKTDVVDRVRVGDNEKQNKVQYGDVLFTGSSETPDECGMSSVLTTRTDEDLYLNSFCFGYRFCNPNMFLPGFTKHLFRSDELRKQITRTASGVTRFNVSKKKMEGVTVPIPPLEIQREIVRVLDNFTFLSAELLARLSAELSARRKQYDYYSNKLLEFSDVRYYSLSDLCDIVDYRGKTPRKSDTGVFLVTAKNIRQGYIDYGKSQEYIPADTYNEVMHRGFPKIGDVLITTEAPCGYVAQVDREDIALAQRVIKYRPKDPSFLDATFLKYILLGKEFQRKLEKASTGGTVKGIKGSILHTLTIPVPEIGVQKKTVELLNHFDSLCHSITDVLPAEIEARQQQCDYYRDKLLTFKIAEDEK